MNENCLKGARKYADFAPGYAGYSEKILFGDLWKRPGLAPRERSLITLAALIACGNFKQLPFHLGLALENGAERGELVELITHVCFYAGWPRADSALEIARHFFETTPEQEQPV